MKSFAKLIGKLPFAGKLAIRPTIFSFYQSVTERERRRNYLWLLLLFVSFVLLHGVQAKMGIEALGFDSPIWAKMVSALYAAANICVIVTQIYLGFRVTRFVFTAPYPRMRRKGNDYSAKQANTMLVVTLGGQVIFLILYCWYY